MFAGVNGANQSSSILNRYHGRITVNAHRGNGQRCPFDGWERCTGDTGWLGKQRGANAMIKLTSPVGNAILLQMQLFHEDLMRGDFEIETFSGQ